MDHSARLQISATTQLCGQATHLLWYSAPSLGEDSSIRLTALPGRKNVALRMRLLEPCLLAHDTHLIHVSCPLTHRRPS